MVPVNLFSHLTILSISAINNNAFESHLNTTPKEAAIRGVSINGFALLLNSGASVLYITYKHPPLINPLKNMSSSTSNTNLVIAASLIETISLRSSDPHSYWHLPSYREVIYTFSSYNHLLSYHQYSI